MMKIVDQVAWQASPEQVARQLEAAKQHQVHRDESVEKVQQIVQEWLEKNARRLGIPFKQ